MVIRENDSSFTWMTVISIICTKSHFQTLVFFLFFESSGIRNQNHYFLSIQDPFSIQVIIYIIMQGRIQSSPNIFPYIVTQGLRFLTLYFCDPVFYPTLLPSPAQGNFMLRGFDVLSTCPGKERCQGTSRLMDKRGSSKNVIWSSWACQWHGRESSQPQKRQ